MRASPCVRVEAPLELRITLLLDEYRHFLADPAALGAQLDCLAGLYGREKIAAWKALVARGAWRDFVAAMLLEHYDPAYRRSSQRNFAQLADAEALALAAPDDAAFDALADQLSRSASTRRCCTTLRPSAGSA